MRLAICLLPMLAACDIEPDREPASISVSVRNFSEEAQRATVTISYNPEEGDRVTVTPMVGVVLDNGEEARVLPTVAVRQGTPLTFRIDTETVAPYHTMTTFREMSAEPGAWRCALVILQVDIGMLCAPDTR